MAARAWRSRWENVVPFFGYPEPIRRVIYTTNAIESLNAQLMAATRYNILPCLFCYAIV